MRGDRRQPVGAKFRSVDPRLDQMQSGNIITFQRIVRPMLFGQPADETAVRDAMPRGHTVFNELSRLLGDRPWFGISLADLMVASHFDFFAQTPECA
jgi:glutathione S-transferase